MAKNSSKSNQDPQSPMALLMAKHRDSFVTFKKGDSVKGKITKINVNEILVDLGSKTEATILEKDKNILRTILGMFKLGDTVEVNVLNPESDFGHPVVSLRRYLGNIAWVKLEELQKSHEQIEVTISEVGKAGFVVATSFGISGFLPQSHTSFSNPQVAAIGQKIKASVLEISREDNKVIFSQKTKMSDDEFAKAMKKYKVGDKVEVSISNITPFGLFVSLGDFEGFIHISEISWDKVDDLASIYNQGDKIEAVIARFDKETKRINLSVRKLTADPFEKLIEKYPVDKKVTATVVKIEDTGVVLDLGPSTGSGSSIEGFIKKEKIPPMTTYSEGQEIALTVSEHDKRRHRLILTPVLKEKPIGYR